MLRTGRYNRPPQWPPALQRREA